MAANGDEDVLETQPTGMVGVDVSRCHDANAEDGGQVTEGGVPAGILADNTQEWSGDHCMTPDAVPGILLTSRPLKQPAASLDKVAAAILAEFGITGFPSSRPPG